MRGRHPDRPSCGPSILVYRVYKCRTGPKPLLDLARPAGIEPATPAFGGQYSLRRRRLRMAVSAALRRVTALVQDAHSALLPSPTSALANL